MYGHTPDALAKLRVDALGFTRAFRISTGSDGVSRDAGYWWTHRKSVHTVRLVGSLALVIDFRSRVLPKILCRSVALQTSLRVGRPLHVLGLQDA